MENFEAVNQERVSEIYRLPSEAPSRIWMEITYSSHKHGGPGWEFGTCLWSPSRDKLNRDWYKLMREVKKGDLVVLSNDTKLVGQSFAKGSFYEVKTEPPSPGVWANMSPYYRIDLEGFSRFPKQISLAELAREYREAISEDIKKGRIGRYPFLKTKHGDLRTVQGGYLTCCTPALYQIILKAVGKEIVAQIGKEPVGKTRYWVIALSGTPILTSRRHVCFTNAFFSTSPHRHPAGRTYNVYPRFLTLAPD
jgi:hypothetical protein